MEKPDFTIEAGSSCKAIKLKENLNQEEYLEENDLEPGTLEKNS